ncbi:MAG TPA: glycosyltransferase family 39 protein [Rubrobacter sp.]|nr:glycosyltransferase family 39 protein [Rubrobacter sp.]
MSGPRTSEKEPVRAYRRRTPSGGAVSERAAREPPLRSLLESRALLVLLAIMLLGAVLRFYGLGFQSLWSDELASWDFSNRETISQVIGGVRSDDNPPLYFLILRFAQVILGDSEWALRFPSAFAGWLCIPAIYLLGKRLYSGREGIVAALFLAVFWAPIYFSQEARVYSMLILFSILTSYFWWNIMIGLRYGRELPTREATLYIVCAVLCAYVDYFGLILVVLQGAALAVLAYGMLRKAMLLYVPVAVAYLPWLPSMVHQSPYGDQNGTRIADTTLQVPPDYFQFLFGRSGLLSFAAWTLLAFLLIRGWDDLRRRRKRGVVPPGLLLAAWAVGPFVVAFVASHSMLTNENLLVSLPAVYLLLARSVTRTFSGRAAAVFQGTVAVGLAAVGLAYLLFSMDYYTTPTKEQFREAALYVVGHEDKNTLVVRCDTHDRLDYYLKTRETGRRNDAEACQSSDFPKIENRVKEGDYKEVFHFISHEDPDQQMVSKFQRSFQPVRYERFDGAAVVVYKVGPSAPEGLPQPEPPSNLRRQE